MSEGGVGHGELGKKERAERVLVVSFVRERVCLQQRDASKVRRVRQKWVGLTSDFETNIL